MKFMDCFEDKKKFKQFTINLIKGIHQQLGKFSVQELLKRTKEIAVGTKQNNNSIDSQECIALRNYWRELVSMYVLILFVP
jgi:hypothetical protein